MPLTSQEVDELRVLMADLGYYGTAGYPLDIAIYAEPGVGKTGDVGRSFHRQLVYIGKRKHLVTIATMTGIPLKGFLTLEADRLDQARSLIYHKVLPLALNQLRKKADGKDAVPLVGYLLDDISIMADGTLEQEVARAETAGGKKDTRKAFSTATSELAKLLQMLSWMPLHTIMTAHRRVPETDDNGKSWSGHPKFPSRNMGVNTFAANVNTILYAERFRVTPDLELPGAEASAKAFGWNASYFCNSPDRIDFISRDRNRVAPTKAPINLREMLRPIWAIPRAPGLEGADDLIDQGIEMLHAGDDYWEVVRPWAVKTLGLAPTDPRVGWMLHDLTSRYQLSGALTKNLPY